ncbi:MAG: Lipoprotein signal peptidase [Anaerolineales bacterium]|nr:Lipoprotein signal peptidase [Anaerolineales bacterium]
MKFLERLALIAVVVLASVGCDQGTKALAEEHLAGQGTISLLSDTVRLHYAENEGALLSLGARLPEPARFWVFTVFVGAVLVATLLFVFRNGDLNAGEVIGLSLILGGGASNLIDRILNDGAVIDFLNIGIANLRSGIFNLADVAVFAGVGLFWLYYTQRQEPHHVEPDAEDILDQPEQDDGLQKEEKGEPPVKSPDPMLERIEAFNEEMGGGVLIRRASGGYSLFAEEDGSPVARLRPTGEDDDVEVLWWSHRDRWEQIGEFGGVVLPLDEALEYVAKDPMGIFWI